VLDSRDLKQIPVVVCCEHGNRLSGSVKDGTFLD
jgi:hypothetical protein